MEAEKYHNDVIDVLSVQPLDVCSSVLHNEFMYTEMCQKC